MADLENPNLGPGNLVTLPDGTKHMFPPGTSVDQMRKTLNLGPQPQAQVQQSNSPNQGLLYNTTPNKIGARDLIDQLRPFIAGGAGALAATGAAIIPGVGESGVAEGLADTQGYALVDSLMKYLGANPPKSYSEALTDSEKDAAINAVAGKLMGTVFKGVKSALFTQASDIPAFYKLAPTTSQALEKYGMNTLAKGVKFLEDYGAPTAKAAALDKSGGEGFTQSLALANSLNGRQAGTNSNPQKLYDKIRFALEDGLDETTSSKVAYAEANKLPSIAQSATGGPTGKLHVASQEALDMLQNGSDHFKVLDDTLNDTDKLAKVLKVGQLAGSPAMNVKKDLAAYKFMDIVNKATTKDLNGGARIDPSMLQELWTNYGDDKKSLLYGSKDTINRIGDFFKDIGYAQDVQSQNPILSRYIKYGPAGKFILGLGTLMHGVTTGNFIPTGVLTGVQISANLMGRLLTNPSTARIVADMAKGSLKDNPTWTAKVLGNALRNQTVGLMSSDGSNTEGSFEENPQTGMLEFRKY